MPTILRFHNFRIMIFTADHLPSHVHAVGPGIQVIFNLGCWTGPPTVRANRGVSQADEKALADLIAANLHCFVRHGGGCMVTQAEHDEAVARGEEMYKTLPRAIGARYDHVSRMVIVDLNRGYSIAFSPKRSQDLHNATAEDLAEVEIAGPGWGVYFPRIDTDLWVPGMAKGIFGTKRWEEDWAARRQIDKAA